MSAAPRSASTGTAAASGAVSVAKPTGTATGDVLIAAHFCDIFGPGGVGAMTGATGFTQTGATHTGVAECHGKVWQRVVDGSEGSSFSFGNDDSSVIIMIAIQGADTTTPIDITTTWAVGGSGQTSQIASSISPGGSDSLLICGAATTSDLTSSYTPPAGMTEQGDAWANFTAATLATLGLVASGATGTKTFTISNAVNNDYLALSLAIKSAAAASGRVRQPLVVPSPAVHSWSW